MLTAGIFAKPRNACKDSYYSAHLRGAFSIATSMDFSKRFNPLSRVNYFVDIIEQRASSAGWSKWTFSLIRVMYFRVQLFFTASGGH
jgi:hypothetical protein